MRDSTAGKTSQSLMRDEQILFRDYPLVFWVMGAFAIVAGVLMRETIMLRVIFALLGVAGVGLGSVLTVRSDPRRRALELCYWSLFRRSIKSYAWDEICSVRVKEDIGEGNFRVELVLCSGEVVPLRNWYSPGKARHGRTARKLESWLRNHGAKQGPEYTFPRTGLGS